MFYPVYLNLNGKRVVVIGGGEVAERKIDSLLDAGANVLVISPEVTARIAALARGNRIELNKRTYVRGDCTGAALVFAATGDPDVSRAVHEEATTLGIFINTADEPAYCTFIMPAVVRRGDIGIAISTNGKSPALAARLRRKISDIVGPEYARMAELLSRVRPEIHARVSGADRRKVLHYRILDSDIISLLKCKDTARAEDRLREILNGFDRKSADQKLL
jgi:precorrin-2 dehydrogenase/sirohydrochlorin ferrochelatase